MSEIKLKARELLAAEYERSESPGCASAIRSGVLDGSQYMKAIIAALAPQWQPIESAPKDGRHEWLVSADGQVARLSPQRTSTKGYRKVSVGGKDVFVHRLVAEAFIPNPNGWPEVNHINGDKADNRAQNLEWCTRSMNMLHAYDTGLHGGSSRSGSDHPAWGKSGSLHTQSMAVRATFKDGSTKDYASQRLAEMDGFDSARISRCITGHRRTHKGATWQPLPAPPEVEG